MAIESNVAQKAITRWNTQPSSNTIATLEGIQWDFRHYKFNVYLLNHVLLFSYSFSMR